MAEEKKCKSWVTPKVPEDGLTISDMEINVAKYLSDELSMFGEFTRAKIAAADQERLNKLKIQFNGVDADLLNEYSESWKKSQVDHDQARGKVVHEMLKKFREIEPFIAEKMVEVAKVDLGYYKQVLERIKTFSSKLFPGPIKFPEDFPQVVRFAVCELSSDYNKYMHEVRLYEKIVTGYTEFLSNIKKLIEEESQKE